MFGRKGRRTPLQREPLADLEDIRDDCIAIFLNSGLTQKQVHEAGGPTPQTISKWLYKETHFPRLDTVRAFYRAVTYDLIPVPLEEARAWRDNQVRAPRMPKKKAHA
jgi:hypothetical protein